MNTIDKVYQYSELSKEAKSNAEYRIREVLGAEFFDFTIPDFEDGLINDNYPIVKVPEGFEVEKLYCSGFFSQGDGSCFDGSFSNEKLSLVEILDDPEKAAVFECVAKLKEINCEYDNYVMCKIVREGKYCHFNSIEIKDFECHIDSDFLEACYAATDPDFAKLETDPRSYIIESFINNFSCRLEKQILERAK